MIIESIKLHNIRSYLSEIITFPKGSVLLSGDIGSGKSTILLALEFAFFGVIRGSLDGSSLLRQGKSQGYVELTMAIDGKRIFIHRGLRRNKNSVAQTAGYIIEQGVKHDCTPVELRARIIELIGYPMSNSKSLVYRYTVYTPQEDMKRILFDDAKDRLDTLRRVFQIETYKQIIENSSIVSRMIKERITHLEGKTENFDNKKNQLETFESQIVRLKDDLSALDKPLAEVRKSIIEVREKVVSRESEIKKLAEVNSLISGANATISARKNLVKSIKTELQVVTNSIAQSTELLANESSLFSEYSLNFSYLQSHIGILKKKIDEIPSVRKRILEFEEKKNQLAQEYARASAQLSSNQTLQKNVLSSDKCPVCMQNITDEHKKGFRSIIDKEIIQAENSISQIANEKKLIDSQVLSEQNILLDLTSSEKFLVRYAEIASQHDQNLVVQPDSLEKLPDANSVISKLSSISTSINALAKYKQTLELNMQRLELLNKNLANALESVENAELNLVTLTKQAQLYEPAQLMLQELRAKNDDLNKVETQILVKQAGLSKEAQTLEFNRKIIAEEIALMVTDKSKLERIMHLKTWFSDFFVSLIGTIERSVMLRIYTEFNSVFVMWFSILMEDDTISARLDEEFSPVVEVNGYEILLENLSGGEKTSCALAYRLALNKVINDIIGTIKTRDFLVLDEPTDGFSSQQLEKVRDVLSQLNLSQVILVSHEQKVESFVDNVIRIVKEQHVSHAIS